MAATAVNNEVGSGAATVGDSPRAHLGSDKLVGVRVVACGSVALTSASPSTAVVTLPEVLPEAVGNYTVMLTPSGATAAIAAGGAAVSSFTTAGFTITGPNTVTTTINWMILHL